MESMTICEGCVLAALTRFPTGFACAGAYLYIGWIIQPAVKTSRSLAVTAVFVAAIIGSDFALAPYPNVKLLDTLVFVAAYVFGFRVGASVAVVSEAVWSVVSPWGVAGAISPFLVSGELLFAVAGWAASRAWGSQLKPGSPYSLAVGSLLALCAFLWDFETNAATALLAFWPDVTAQKIISTELFGALFALVHELSDFVLGSVVAPVVISMIPRATGRWS
jgi:hypothetical protein